MSTDYAAESATGRVSSVPSTERLAFPAYPHVLAARGCDVDYVSIIILLNHETIFIQTFFLTELCKNLIISQREQAEF